IFFLSLSRIFSTFFSGTGKPQINTISSAIGLVMVTGFGFLLIPRWAFVGAGIPASVTYFSSFMFQLIIFVRRTKLRAGDFLIGKEDINRIKVEFQNFFKNGK
ncbi:MAG: polysaccharide biosynthesis C-terminal domain-containing protein, partial [Bacteroidales bacterium]|nr:polysaccharide biosynthesis C-terminal domain-containing protein [Bacteroidales bacterium]